MSQPIVICLQDDEAAPLARVLAEVLTSAHPAVIATVDRALTPDAPGPDPVARSRAIRALGHFEGAVRARTSPQEFVVDLRAQGAA